jgi:hypothetical protein
MTDVGRRMVIAMKFIYGVASYMRNGDDLSDLGAGNVLITPDM